MLSNKRVRMFVCFGFACIFQLQANAQDSAILKKLQLPDKYLNAVNEKLNAFNSRSDKYTQIALKRIIKQEKKMKAKVSKVDSLLSKKLFSYSIDSLQKLQATIKIKSAKVSKYLKADYFPYIDTLRQSLAFLKQTKTISKEVKNIRDKVSSSMKSVEEAENNFRNIEKIETYIKDRQQILKDQLDRFPQLANNVKKINKEAYYFAAQIKEYKTTLKDPAKIERLVLDQMKKIPAFQQLMQQNSQLSGLFTSPASFSGLIPAGSIPVVNGLAIRSSVQSFIQANIPLSKPFNPFTQIQQQLPEAKSQLDQLKNKLNEVGGMKNKAMPDFKPNTQRTKTIWKRIEYGTDVQFGKSVNYIPATGNIALKLGYKLNDKSIVGVGANYVVGFGEGWKKVKFSSEGVGLRTYIKWKIKKGLDVQGGSEWNYMLQFKNVDELKNINAWQQSALIGLSKNYAIGKKLKGNLQVLYDFLYNRHIPRTQPVVFRFGYGL